MSLDASQIPNLFIVGAPKCGTTSVHDFLAGQASVLMSRYKEPHFFARDLYAPQFIRSGRAYRDLFASAAGQPWRGESSPLYMYSKVAAECIRDFNSQSRLVVCLRRPADAAISLHNGIYANGKESVADFEESFRLQWERKLGVFVRGEGYPRASFDYLGVFSYAPQLRRVFAVFPRDQVHIVLMDDLLSDPGKVVEGLSQFLGVPLRGDIPRSNEAKGVRSRSLQRFMMQLPYGPRRYVGRLLPRWVKHSLQDGNRAVVQRPVVSDELRQSVMQMFAADVLETETIIGRSLSHWLVD